MDRFRFRAWYEYMGSWFMDEVDSFSLIDNEIEVYFKSGNQGVAGELNEHVYLMQCTGLKDSEGKLIWEGDIVKRYNEINPDYGFDVCEVRLNQARCYFELRGQKEYYGHICGNHANDGRYAVIGNIYENPELLGE